MKYRERFTMASPPDITTDISTDNTDKMQSKKESDSETVQLIHSSTDDQDQVESGVYSYESAIKACGYGRFHVLLLLACGWANAGDAVEVLCTSFLLPSAECDLKLSSSDKGWMNAIIFVGMMTGGYVWGSLADSYGRKATLFSSLIFNGIFGFLSSFAQSFPLFLFLRFLSGLGVGGNIPTVWSYFVEFQPKNRRGSMLSFLATFWMVGNIITAGLAWIVIPQESLNYYSDTFSYGSWRVFVALTTVPCITAALFISLLPESPKFLMDKGKEDSALRVLQYIYNVNHSYYPRQPYPVRSLILGNVQVRLSNIPFGLKRMKEIAQRLYWQTKELFTQHYRVMVLMLFINFSLAFGYYGLWLWFPELYKRMDSLAKAGYTDVSVCSSDSITTNSSLIPSLPNCDELDNKKDSFYTESFILAVSNFPGNVFTIFCMDRLGRKSLLALSMLVCGVSVFFIYFVSSELHNIILSCIFGGVSVITWNTLDVLGVELFPTQCRSTALGICLVSARIGAILGNVVFGQLIDTNCVVPIMMVAAFLMAGGFSGCALPNTTKIELL